LTARQRVVRIFCLLPFGTGSRDLGQGVRALRPAGAVVPDRVAVEPALHGQVKFLGAIWFGYGLPLWRASADPRANARLFRLLLGILFLSGIGRAAAAVQFGRPGRLFTGAMVLELVGAPLMLRWHRVALRQTVQRRPLGPTTTTRGADPG